MDSNEAFLQLTGFTNEEVKAGSYMRIRLSPRTVLHQRKGT